MAVFAFTMAAIGAPLPFRQSEFRAGGGSAPAGWAAWAPRAEIAPRTRVSAAVSRGGPGSLEVAGAGNPAAFGGWERSVAGIEPGKWYRFTVFYRAQGLTQERTQALARLDWAMPGGRRAGQPEYGWQTAAAGTWRKVTVEAPAPEKASAARLQLLLVNAANGAIWWDDVSLEAIPAPAARNATIAALNFRPAGLGSAEANVRRFIEAATSVLPAKTDIVVMGEGITLVGTRFKYVDVAEPVPGPATALLGEAARRWNSYVVAGIYEREGGVVYNTAVLLDRGGRLAGKYRKVYIPREEMEGGITPGGDYPVFDTDFGRIGIMICWDLQYSDPARAMALKGAELILMPIWGGNETLAKARAIENHVFLAATGYDHPTYVLDPNGETLASAPQRGRAAVATIDLNRRYADPWLGLMRGRFVKELRLDIPLEPPGALKPASPR